VKFVDRGKAPERRSIRGCAALSPLLRLVFFLTATGALVSAFLLRSVQAEVAEVFWGVSAEIMQYPGAPQEEVRELLLNGVRVSFRTQTVDAPLAEVLAHYETLCDGSDARHNKAAGYVACVDMGDAPRDLRSLVERFARFSQTGDLRQLGELRYVHARRLASATGEQTFVFTMWADSDFNLHRMLPGASGDAAGRDFDGVPRPPGSQRVLSAWEAQQPSGVVVYRVASKSAAELESFYRIELSKNGWAVIERNPSESIEIDEIHMISAEQGNRSVTVLSHPGEASQTVLTILVSEPS
jgi:hypothetical protein